ADALGLGGEIGLVVAVVARHDGNAEALHEVARVRLRAHRLDRGGPRADEDDLRLLARRGKLRTFGEEAVAGMDGIGAARARRVDDAADVEVRRAERDGIVEEASNGAAVVIRRVAGD